MSSVNDHPSPLRANSPDPEPPPTQETAANGKTPDISQFPKPPPRSNFKPQCTHVNMVRAYGATCQNCNRKSPLGWVYQCTYDEGDDPWAIVAHRQPAVEACDPSDLIGMMKALDFNHSIIAQAEKGLYTPEQIERLISQKQKVLDIINSQSPDKVAADFRAKTQSPTATAVAKERAKHLRTVHPRCRFKCCQTCRGDFRARAFESFEAVCDGEVKPLRLADTATLPVRDVQVIREIGMRFQPLVAQSSFSTDSGESEHREDKQEEEQSETSERAESTRTWRTTDSAREFRSRETAQARTFYRVEPEDDLAMFESMHFNDFSFRRSVRNSMSFAAKHIFRKRRESSSDGSAVTLPLACSQKAASSKNFQDSGLSLPKSFFGRRNPSISGIPPSTIFRGGLPTPAPTCSTGESDRDGESINEEDGGVSLTEESVEVHKPDLVPQSITAQA